MNEATNEEPKKVNDFTVVVEFQPLIGKNYSQEIPSITTQDEIRAVEMATQEAEASLAAGEKIVSVIVKK